MTSQWIWLATGLLLLAISISPSLDGDGAVRLADAVRLATGHWPQEKFSLWQPLLSVPLYWLGAVVATPEAGIAYFNFTVFALMLLSLWRYLPGRRERSAILLLLMAASMFPQHLQHYNGEVLTACACTIGILLLAERPILATMSLAVGAADTPATLPALALALLFYAVRTRRPAVLLALALAVGLMVGENLLKYGTLASASYSSAGEHGMRTMLPYSGLPGFSYPFGFGVLSILFSFGKGLTFFVPGLFLRAAPLCPRMSEQEALAVDTLCLFVLGLVLVYARWWAWYGGVYWGPRFFLIACVPAALLIAYRLSEKLTWTLFVVVGLSAWVCAQGFLYGLRSIGDCLKDDYALEMLCWYTPEFSPLWRQFVEGFPEIGLARGIYVAWCVASLVALLARSQIRSVPDPTCWASGVRLWIQRRRRLSPDPALPVD